MAGWLTKRPRWLTLHDASSTRRPGTPNIIALHLASRRMLAVHVRPRRLHPSKTPNAPLPDGVVSVVWRPGLRTQVRAWLASPDSDPPGLVAGTWEAP